MMARFVARRLLIALLQLIGVALVVFFLIRLLPADPVARLVGMNATEDAYRVSQRSLGLDQSIGQQLLNYLGVFSNSKVPGLAQGSLGESWVSNKPITEEIGRFLPVTLEIITYSLLISFLVAIPLGMASATNPGGLADRFSFGWGMFAGAQPDYWWGLLFVFVFFFWLNIAPPPLGRMDPLITEPKLITGFLTIDAILLGRFDIFVSAMHHMMLPVFTLVFGASGAILKMIRQNMIRTLQSDFVLYARACGLPQRQVARYALRVALTPAITLVGIFYGVLLSAAVTVEIVFTFGGIGEYAVRSILAFDYPAIQAVVLVVALLSLLIYLALDIIHAFLDPRIRY